MKKSTNSKNDIYLKLLCYGIQKGLNMFLTDEHLKNVLDNKDYIYHGTLNNSMKPNASVNKIARAVYEVWSYCNKHSDSLIELLEDILNEEEKCIREYDGEDEIVTLFTLTQKDIMVNK